MKRFIALRTFLCLTLAIASCVVCTPRTRAATEFPAAAQPQLATATDGRVWLTYGSGKDIFVARSRDAGATFEAPVRVATLPALQLGMRRGPRLTAFGDHLVVTAMAGDFFAFHSNDGGTTWSAPVRINDAPGATREGLHDLALAPDGRLFALWLDLRAGPMQLCAAESIDHGAIWSPNEVVYRAPAGPICTCCQPSARFNTRGDLCIMWRNDLDGARDMWSAVRPAGSTPFGPAAKLGQGTWPLKACPMDGGSLVPSGDAFTTLWQRDGAIFVARPGAPERRLALGKQPVAASTPTRTVAVWQQGSELWTTTLDRDAAPTLLAPAGRFASLVAIPGTDHVLVAYEKGPASIVTRLDQPTPTPPAAAAASKRYALRGVIVAIDAGKSALRIKHEEIPGVMRAMTMQFRVDATALQAAQVGATLTGLMSRQPEHWLLEDVKIGAAN
jgi:Cu/Ag efflux protein CusF